MTVAALTPSVDYIEDGVSTAFPLPFRFLDPGEILAQRELADGTLVDLVYGVNFTVAGGDTDAGGTLTVTAPAAAGVKLHAWRETTRDQDADYTTADRFPAQSHERALDKARLIDQEQDVDISRALKVRRGGTGLVVGAVADGQVLALVGGEIAGVTNDPASAADSAATALAAKAGAEAAKDGALDAKGGAEQALADAETAADDSSGFADDAREARDAALATGGMLQKATYAELAAVVGTAGQIASVLSSDTGTHTDPVAGGTVSNAGQYSYSVSPAGWRWRNALESKIAADAAAAATAALPSLKAAIGTDLRDVVTATIGDTLASGTNSNAANIYLSKPLDRGALVTVARLSIAGAFAGSLRFYRLRPDGRYENVYVENVVSAAGGIVPFTLSTAIYLPAGSRYGYKVSSGNGPRYSAGTNTLPRFVAADDTGVGSVLTVAGTDANLIIGLQFDYIYSPTSVEPRLSSAEAGVAANQASLSALAVATYSALSAIGQDTPDTSNANVSRTYMNPPTAAGGLLSKVRLRVLTGGTGEIRVYKVNGSNIEDVKIFPVTVADGLNEFPSSFFGGYILPDDWLVGYRAISSSNLRYNAGGRVYSVLNTADTGVGASMAPTIENVATLALEVTVGHPPKSVLAARPSDKSLLVERQVFVGTTVSTAWGLTGWSWSNGLVASSAGWGQVGLYNTPSSASKKRISARIKINAASDQVGICFSPQENSRGTVALVNGTSGNLELYLWTGPGNAGTLAKSVALPSALVPGRVYELEVAKDGISHVITLRDTVDQTFSASISQAQGDGTNAGACHGSPGVICLAGTPTVTAFDYRIPVRPQPWAVILTDSIGEGSDITPASDWNFSWPYLLDADRNRGDLVLGLRGGDETPNLLTRLATDLSIWNPAYVVLQEGTNDPSQAVWRATCPRSSAWCRREGPFLSCAR
ncbi:hypothetical protein [Novosphingobium sp. ST904]|uniref:hypothetical protein n=1 Tax=Novosphingobium sp. ST904 TaxID=1684385 RepID=UPI0006C8E587|nr:hypothetical protein [Novosphingobium sp. ST904]KPH66318.1 hypothetical protein ADT71_06525 [Novosphingobium sp. ST904]